MWWDYHWRGFTRCLRNSAGETMRSMRPLEFAGNARRPNGVFDALNRRHEDKKRAATRAALLQKISPSSARDYFFSSVTGAEVEGGGVETVVVCAVFCGLPCIPSLKLRIPSPKPFMTSGIFLPPKSSTTMARTINQ